MVAIATIFRKEGMQSLAIGFLQQRLRDLERHPRTAQGLARIIATA